MKLWKYIHLNTDNKTVPIDEIYKEPFIWSSTAPSNDYTEASEVETKEKAIIREIEFIEQRTKDGILAYEKALAEMRLSRISNNIPHEVFTTNVYTPMDIVINAMNRGSWIDAYEFLNIVESNPYLSITTLKGFRITISNYIVNSGNYEDYTGKTIDENGYIIN